MSLTSVISSSNNGTVSTVPQDVFRQYDSGFVLPKLNVSVNGEPFVVISSNVTSKAAQFVVEELHLRLKPFADFSLQCFFATFCSRGTMLLVQSVPRGLPVQQPCKVAHESAAWVQQLESLTTPEQRSAEHSVLKVIGTVMSQAAAIVSRSHAVVCRISEYQMRSNISLF